MRWDTFVGITFIGIGLSKAVALVVRPTSLNVAPENKTNQFRHCVGIYADKLDSLRPELGKLIRSHPGTVRKTSNRSLIIGAGSGNTGTSSLTTALVRLGLNVAHDHETLIPRKEYCPFFKHLRHTLFDNETTCIPYLRQFDFTTVPKKLDAVVDAPYAELFIDLFLTYPHARFILTDRPQNDWARARMRFDEGYTNIPLQEPCGLVIGPDVPLDKFAQLYTINNEFVRCMVPPNRLFEINVFTNNTPNLMMKLAKFLDRKLPTNQRHKDLAFPHDPMNGFTHHYHFRSCYNQTMRNKLMATKRKITKAQHKQLYRSNLMQKDPNHSDKWRHE